MRPVQPLGTPPFDGGSGLMHIDWIRWFGDLAKAVENVSNNTYAPVTPSALTRANDTNVTVTLTGSPTVALLAPVLMTMGWAGVLSVSRGGTGTGTAFTAGSVIFAGPSGVYAQDNAHLFWDDTNNFLGVGTLAPAATLHVASALASICKLENTTVNGRIWGIEVVGTGASANGVLLFIDRTSNVRRGLFRNDGACAFGGNIGNDAGNGAIIYADPVGGVGINQNLSLSSFTIQQPADTTNIGGTTTANAATTIVGVGTLFQTTLGVGDRISLSSAASTYATVTAIASNTSLTVNAALGNGTSQTINRKRSIIRLDNSATVVQAIMSDLGDVGIGTVTPQASLEVLRGSGASSVPAVLRLSNNADTIAAGDTIGRIDFFSGDNSGGGDSVICKIVATQRTTTPVDGELGFFVGSAAATEAIHIISTGRVGFQVASPTAILHLKAGTTAASTAPLKFNSGSLLTTAEAGAVEFLTDGFYATITTGAARKGIVLDDGTALTSGRVPFATTNGRLTDDADLTFATDTLTTTKLVITNKLTSYNAVTTAGWGVPAIQAEARSTAQVAAVASVAAYTCGVADGSFVVSMNVNVTTSTTHNFTAECAYTDETNTARVLTLTFSQLAGVFVTAITNVTGAGPYEGVPMHIRVKASTAITLRTQAAGTYTTVTYNVEGLIQQVA